MASKSNTPATGKSAEKTPGKATPAPAPQMASVGTTARVINRAHQTKFANRNMYEGPEVQKMVRRATQWEKSSEIHPHANFVVHGHFYQFSPVSLGFLPETSRFRQFMVWFTTWKWWDRIVLLVIVLNTLLLALTDYSLNAVDPETLEPDPAKSSLNALATSLEPFFTTLFTIECVAKIIAMGFVLDQGSYLRDWWNVLDFIVVVTSILQSIPGVPKASALRAFRILRPLRTLSRLAGMRMMVNSLLSSIPQLLNVGVLLVFLFAVYSILAINLFQGSFHARCRITATPVKIPGSHLLPWTGTPPWEVSGDYNGLVDGGAVDPSWNSSWPHRPLYFEMLERFFAGDGASDTAIESSSDTQIGALPWAVKADYYVSFSSAAMYIWSLVHNRTAFPACGAGDALPDLSAVFPTTGIPLHSDDWKQDTSPWFLPRQCAWPMDLDIVALCNAWGSSGYQCEQTELYSTELPSHIDATSEIAAIVLNMRNQSRVCGSDYDAFGNPRFVDDRIMKEDVEQPEFFFGLYGANWVGQMFLTIYQCVTLEGWSTIMYWTMDAYQPVVGAVFYVVLTLVGSMFLLNLVVASIFLNFNASQFAEQESLRVRRERVAAIQKAEKEDALRARAKARLVADIRHQGVSSKLKLRRVSLSDGPFSPDATEAAEKMRDEISREDSLNLSGIPEPHAHGVMRRRMQRKLSRGTSLKGAFDAALGTPAATPRSTDIQDTGRSTGIAGPHIMPRAVRPSMQLDEQSVASQALPVDAKSTSAKTYNKGLSRVSSMRSTISSWWGGKAHSVAGSEALRAPTVADAGSVAGSVTSLTSTILNAYDADIMLPINTPVWLRFRLAAMAFFGSGQFGLLMLCLILLNTATLSLDAYPEDDNQAHSLEMVNFSLTCFFGVEMIGKLVAMQPKAYFRDRFNAFDFVIVIISIVDLAVAPPYFLTGHDSRGSSVLALRTLRLTRIFKLARSWTSLRMLLKTIKDAINDVAYFAILLLLYLLIFSLFGMQLFANRFRFDPRTHEVLLPSNPAYWGENVDIPRSNFDSLWRSFLCVFQIVTSEDWGVVMMNAYMVAGSVGIIYMVAAHVIGAIVLLSLFLAIVLGAFEGLDDPNATNNDEDVEMHGGMGLARDNKSTASSRNRMSRKGSKKSLQEGHSARAPSVARNHVPDGSECGGARNFGQVATVAMVTHASGSGMNLTGGRSVRSGSSYEGTTGIPGRRASLPGAAGNTPRSIHTPNFPAAVSAVADVRSEFTGSTRTGMRRRRRRVTVASRVMASVAAFGHRKMAQVRSIVRALRDAHVIRCALALRGEVLRNYGARRRSSTAKRGDGASVRSQGDAQSTRPPVDVTATRRWSMATTGLAESSPMPPARPTVSLSASLSIPTGTTSGQGAPQLLTLKQPSEDDDADHSDSDQSWLEKLSSFSSGSMSSHGRGTVGSAAATEDSEDMNSSGGSSSGSDAEVGLLAEEGHVRHKATPCTRLSNWLLVMFCCCIQPGWRSGRASRRATHSGRDKQMVSRTLFCFYNDHPLRKLCLSIMQNRHFESVVLIVILLSSTTLAMDSPNLDPDGTLVAFLRMCDYAWTVFFTAELAIKVIGNGLLLTENGYLRSGWNVLDMIVVVVSIFSMATDGNTSFRSLRALRALRALRPLRVISRNPSLRLVVNALFRALQPILNVMLVCSLIFLVFAIIATSLFKGSTSHCAGRIGDLLGDDQRLLLIDPVPWVQLTTTQRRWGLGCSSGPYTVGNASADGYPCPAGFGYGNDIPDDQTPTSKTVCLWYGGSWERVVPQSFDDVVSSMGVLLEMSTTENWVAIMYATADSNGIEMEPIRDNNLAIGGLWIVFMLFGAYFTVNLFVAAIVDEFERSKEELGQSYLLTDAQKEWVRTQEVLLMVKPRRRAKPPQNPWRRSTYWLVSSERFEQFILLCIVINTIVLAVPYFGMPQTFIDGLDLVNDVFAAVFTIEALLKIFAFGFGHYWQSSSWNKFDFLVVVASDVGILLTLVSDIDIGAIPTLARIIRIARIIRLAHSLKSLRDMIAALMITIPPLMNIGALLLLVLFIYAIAGVQLFAQVKFGSTLERHANFQNVGYAMLTLWRCLTGEAWNGIMYDLANTEACNSDPEWNDPFPTGCGSSIAFAYFYSFVIINTYTVVQLLIAVVLEAFSDVVDEDAQRLNKDELDKFAETWVQFDPDCTLFMSTNKLRSFLAVLPPPMGFGIGATPTPEEVTAFIASLRLPTYAGNFVHFSDVALACARRIIASTMAEKGSSFEDIPNTHAIAKRWEKLRGAAVTFQTDWSIQHFVAAETIQTTFRVFRFRRALAL